MIVGKLPATAVTVTAPVVHLKTDMSTVLVVG
jgi:hypothetical protein